MKKSLLVTVLVCMWSAHTFAADNVSAAKITLIDTLLEQTGQSAIEMGNQFSSAFSQQMNHMLQQSQPSINPKAFAIIEEESLALINEELVINGQFHKMMHPIYRALFPKSEQR